MFFYTPILPKMKIIKKLLKKRLSDSVGQNNWTFWRLKDRQTHLYKLVNFTFHP
jgi:hypothetical protein